MSISLSLKPSQFRYRTRLSEAVQYECDNERLTLESRILYIDPFDFEISPRTEIDNEDTTEEHPNT